MTDLHVCLSFNKFLAFRILLPSSVRSSFTLSIHLFLCVCFVCLLYFLTVSLYLIRSTCPIHCSRRSRSLSIIMCFTRIQFHSNVFISSSFHSANSCYSSKSIHFCRKKSSARHFSSKTSILLHTRKLTKLSYLSRLCFFHLFIMSTSGE